MPLYIAKSGDLDRCYRCLTDWLTDSHLKDRATQLLIKYKSGALVTQYSKVMCHLWGPTFYLPGFFKLFQISNDQVKEYTPSPIHFKIIVTIPCDADFHHCRDKAFDGVDVCVGVDESLLCTRILKRTIAAARSFSTWTVMMAWYQIVMIQIACIEYHEWWRWQKWDWRPLEVTRTLIHMSA